MVEDYYKKLKEGKRFKNYKEICDFLEEPLKTGGAKQNQLARWAKYFKWEQEKYEFIIIEIFDKPLPMVTEREYNEEIKNILIDLFENNIEDNIEEKNENDTEEDKEAVSTYFFTKKNLALYLGMYNNRFDILSDKVRGNSLQEFLKRDEEKDKKLSYEEKELKQALQLLTCSTDVGEINLPIIEDISTYISYAKNRIYQLLQRNLNYLQTDQLIMWSEGEILVNLKTGKQIEATSNQEVIIKELKKQEALKMGYSNTYLLLQKEGEKEKYYQNVDKRIKERLGYDSAYSIIKIKFYKERIAKEFCRIYGIEYDEYKKHPEKYKIIINNDERDIHQIGDMEYFKNKKELSQKVYKGLEKGLESNYKRKLRQKRIKELSKEDIETAVNKGEIKSKPRKGIIKQSDKDRIIEENKGKIQEIFNENKERIKIEEIEMSEVQKETQKKLNKLCVINDIDIEKLSEKELKNLRKQEKDEVNKLNYDKSINKIS